MTVSDRAQPLSHEPTPAEPTWDHAVQFYETDAFLFETVGAFVASGLAAGQTVVVVATPEHRAGLADDLAGRGIDVDAVTRDRRLVMLDARRTLDALMVDGAPDRERLCAQFLPLLSRPGSGDLELRVYGEMVDLLWREGNREAAVQLEQLWNELGQARSFSLLCAYEIGNFGRACDGQELQKICGAHARVAPAESYLRDTDAQSRQREITWLQHRARALEDELEHRKQLERALRDALAQRRRAEQERETLLKRERASNAAKDEFLAMLGHELRNPLAPIVTALELMRAQVGDAAQRERTIIERQVTHLRGIVDGLLDVSRITRGIIELDRRPIELSHALRKALETASPVLEKRRHCVRTSIPASGMRVEADEARIAQVVTNLLVNAATYTPPGGLIEIEASRQDDQAVIVVRDNGDGIDPELLPNVFEVFVQGARPLARSQGGLGLGLSTVRSLVHMHGGTVEAASDGTGKGSELTVRLPLCDTLDNVVVLQRAREPEPGGTSSRRILVVDDNRDAAVMLAEVLRAAGHEVHVAFDGPAALDRALELVPDVVLLDLGLPQMDGYEVARALGRHPEHTQIKLVAVTGYGQPSDRDRTREAGFSDHLVKPVAMAEVGAVLDRLFCS